MSLNVPCSVCDKIKSNHVNCPYCNYTSCVSCTEKYLLETVHDYHCMSCRKEWSSDFVDSCVSRAFLRLYRVRTEQSLFDHEKNFFPSTQQYVISTVKLSKVEHNLHELYNQMKVLQEQVNQAKKEKLELQKQLCTRETIVYQFHCPVSECKGYINSNLQCGLCKCHVCNDCHVVIKDTTHVCVQETIDSIKSIQSNTKPCPGCQVPIHKESGCDQMWCIHCHVWFKWSTLEIERGILHNPHYFEYLSQHKGSCHEKMRPLQNYDLPRIESLLFEKIKDVHLAKNIYLCVQSIIKLRETQYPEIPRQNEYTHQDLRIRFMMNELGEEEYKSLLYRRSKHNKGYQAYQYILDTYFTITQEWLENVGDDFMEKHKTLRLYLNEQINRLVDRFEFKFKCIV